MKYELESGAHSTYLLTYHLLWCVKYRRKVLTTQIGDRVKQMVETLLREAECTTIAIETDVDHIQVVFRAKPKHQLSKIINSVKGVTARRLFQEFPTVKNLVVERAPVEPVVFSGDGRWCAVGSNQAVC